MPGFEHARTRRSASRAVIIVPASRRYARAWRGLMRRNARRGRALRNEVAEHFPQRRETVGVDALVDPPGVPGRPGSVGAGREFEYGFQHGVLLRARSRHGTPLAKGERSGPGWPRKCASFASRRRRLAMIVRACAVRRFPRPRRIPADFNAPCFRRAELPYDTVELARFLIGKTLVHDHAAARLAGRIIETEAYVVGDAAGHAFRGETTRNRSLFLRRGHAERRFGGTAACSGQVSDRLPASVPGAAARARAVGGDRPHAA